MSASDLLGTIWDSSVGNRWEVIEILDNDRVRVRLCSGANKGDTFVWHYSSVCDVAGKTRVK